MRHESGWFGDQDLDLVYIAKRLKEALKLEGILTDAGIDYAVETDTYHGGIIFRSERVGAFFYVLPAAAAASSRSAGAQWVSRRTARRRRRVISDGQR